MSIHRLGFVLSITKSQHKINSTRTRLGMNFLYPIRSDLALSIGRVRDG